MSGREAAAVRCYFCETKLCTFIITCKWIFASAFSNCYSKRWENSLPSHERAKQRIKKRRIRLYQLLVFLTTIWHLWITVDFYGRRGINKSLMSIILGFVYLFNFWYDTQGRREFQVISRAWHLGEERAPYSKIHMPEHVKLVVAVISVTQIAVALWSSRSEVAWFLVTVLHYSSFYFFVFNSNFIRLFPQDKNRNNQLIYKIESAW